MKRWIFFLVCLCDLSFAEPPRNIPNELYDQFTLNKKIPVRYMYRDDSYPASAPKFYSKVVIDENIDKIRRKEVSYYQETDTWLYAALEKYPIQGKEVGIIGSAEPWYESIVIAYGGYPTTIEYNTINTDDQRLTIMTVDEFNKNPKKFDVILSISSIEHDGLGRYGDPINPNGDLESMEKTRKELLKPDGRLILAVPIGIDTVVWNLHRVYGPIRLSMLLDGWKILDSFGFDKSRFNGFYGLGSSYQPVFYLAPER